MPEADLGSKAYQRSIAEQTAHHAASKTFSGSLVVSHLPRLIELAREHRCESGLDYGCGKGVQYETMVHLRQGAHALDSGTFEEHLRFKLAKWDPCVPRFAEPAPSGRHDLVIVSHVLFWIPLEDLQEWILPRIFRLTRKVLFIVETIGPEKKRILSEREKHPRDLHAIDWIDLLLPHRARFPSVDVRLVTEYRSGFDGRVCGGEWKL